MAVSVLDVIEIIAKMTQAGQQIRNVYQAIHSGTGDVTEAGVMATVGEWLELFYGEFFGVMSDELTFDTFEVVNLTDKTPVGEEPFPVLTVGLGADQASPLQISAVIRFPSNHLGSQGRKFVPGLTENIINDNGELTGSFVTSLTDGALFLIDGFEVEGEQFLYGADNPGLFRFSVFQSVVVNDIVGTQRRRKQGVGI